MKSKLLAHYALLAAWGTLTVYASQYNLVAGIIAILTGVFIAGYNIQRQLHNYIEDNKLSVNRFEKKINLTIDGIKKLGRQEELQDLNPELRNDSLGVALMSASELISKIKREEEQRKWIADGLVKFVEMLQVKQELKEFGYSIISALVRYVGANQGGLYIEYREDKTRYMDLIACYAYDKRKYIEQRVDEGQGIIGQCMLEQDLIFMTDVPKDYVKITSGLGEATPRNVTIVPLMVREKFYGVIELASFEVLLPHQIEFLRKVCENIASEIAAIKSLAETKHLLDESITLTHELRTQEEEMSQNLRALAATQEAMARKQAEMDGYLAAINITIASAEFDLAGNYINGNDIFLKVLGYQNNELLQKDYQHLMPEEGSVTLMWENLKLGKFFSGEFKMKNKAGEECWLTGTFNPVASPSGEIEKIMMLAQFTTQEKERLNELHGMVHALKVTLPVAELNPQFIFKTANDRFMKLFGIGRLQLKGKSMRDFLGEETVTKAILLDILSRGHFNTVLPMKIGNQIVYFEVSLSSVQGLDGQLSRIILILVKEVSQQVTAMAAAV